MIFKIPKGRQHAFVQVQQVLSNFGFAFFRRVFEFHATQLVQYAAHVVAYCAPGDFVFRLGRRLDRTTSRVVEADQIVQHQHGFVEWTIAVIGRVAVLLQVVVLDQFGHFKRYFVRFGERILHINIIYRLIKKKNQLLYLSFKIFF